jgi:hypothetical protein
MLLKIPRKFALDWKEVKRSRSAERISTNGISKMIARKKEFKRKD